MVDGTEMGKKIRCGNMRIEDRNPIKKEIFIWYWELIEADHKKSKIPKLPWKGYLATPDQPNTWQVSLTLLYPTVKSAPLK